MTDQITVRPATLAYVPQIAAVHAGEEDPWADQVECAICVNHRILRGFFVDVAVVEGVAAGHAEWIISHEPPPFGRHLYLGMLHIHPEYRRRGVGRAMLEYGMQRAKAKSCPVLRTVPEEDAKGFYRSCGFSPSFETETYTVKVGPETLPAGWRPVRTVPRKVVRTLPMRWGWVQGSSAHMWEICNRPVRLAHETLHRPCAGRHDGRAYVQLHCWGTGPEAMAISWAAPEVDAKELLSAAISLSHALPVEQLGLIRLKQEPDLLSADCGAQPAGAGEVWSKNLPQGPAIAPVGHDARDGAHLFLDNFRKKLEHVGHWRKDGARQEWIRMPVADTYIPDLDGIGDIQIQAFRRIL